MFKATTLGSANVEVVVQRVGTPEAPRPLVQGQFSAAGVDQELLAARGDRDVVRLIDDPR